MNLNKSQPIELYPRERQQVNVFLVSKIDVRLDFLKSSRSPRPPPPPPGGSVGLSEKSKVAPPLPLVPRGSKRPSKSAASGRKMCFSRDLRVIFVGIQHGWRVGWTSQKVQGPAPPVAGSLGNPKPSKVHGGGSQLQAVSFIFLS